ncbi:hypothetical protein KPH14_003558 [Odynerus spinipes]|uniref:Uncharacterized protein n=1 Tax=Odynerus spinipes TaxID=1348599 RepID=A0AAD9RCZ1_9HYME|nr:hypothetical protein KPH14_003558 [Odynerus spinipes]
METQDVNEAGGLAFLAASKTPKDFSFGTLPAQAIPRRVKVIVPRGGAYQEGVSSDGYDIPHLWVGPTDERANNGPLEAPVEYHNRDAPPFLLQKGRADS